MNNSHLKAATALVAVLLTVGFAAAQPENPGGEKEPDTMDSKKPDEKPNVSKGKMNRSMPDLPSQASNVAKQVTSTVDKFLSGSIPDLGNALSSLLGGNNETEPNRS